MKLAGAIVVPVLVIVIAALTHDIYHQRHCTICRFVTALKRRRS